MIRTLPDVTGAQVATPLATVPTRVNWVKLSGWTIVHLNTGISRIGDAATSATQGCVVPINGEVTLSPASGTDSFDLAATYLYIAAAGDVIQISYNVV